MRRAAQIKRHFPHLEIKDVRGNLNTRLRKLDEDGVYAALILAVAGVKRMNWEDRITQYLSPEISLYAIGQGALGIECRENDAATRRLLAPLSHFETLLRCVSERAFLKTLEGGCSAPVAVHSTYVDNVLHLTGGVWSLDGTKTIVQDAEKNLNQSNNEKKFTTSSFAAVAASHIDSFFLEEASKLGVSLAEDIITLGGGAILKEAKQETENRKLVAANVPPVK